jgi:hypothetical protein
MQTPVNSPSVAIQFMTYAGAERACMAERGFLPIIETY